MKLFNRSLLLFILLMTVGPAQAGEPLLLGVLDESRCPPRGSDADDGDVHRFLRVPFVKAGHGWLSMTDAEAATPLDPAGMNWTVAHDGQTLGRLTSRGPVGDRPQDDPTGMIYGYDRSQSTPEIANQGGAFAGKCGAPALRPLVLVSQPNYRDPDAWDSFMPDDDYFDLLYDEFPRIVGEAVDCLPVPGHNESVFVELHLYKGLIFNESYRDRGGRQLLSIALDWEHDTCTDPYLKPGIWPSHWYLIEGDDIRHIGVELELIDAGDYDDDGKSELLFWYSGRSREGYKLYYDDFRRQAEFLWSDR